MFGMVVSQGLMNDVDSFGEQWFTLVEMAIFCVAEESRLQFWRSASRAILTTYSGSKLTQNYEVSMRPRKVHNLRSKQSDFLGTKLRVPQRGELWAKDLKMK